LFFNTHDIRFKILLQNKSNRASKRTTFLANLCTILTQALA